MLGSGPGPAPTPSMTLPPLRELDKVLGPESEHNRLANHHSVPSGQPRSQSSDPHLHQHFQQQRPQQHQQQQQQQTPQQQHHQYAQKLPLSQHSYQHHDQPGRYSSLSGSLPGSLWIGRDGQDEGKDLYMSATRTDSVSSKDYPHGHTHRHLPSASAHETGPGRSDSSPGHPHPQQHQQQQHQSQHNQKESTSPTSTHTTSSATATPSSKTSAQTNIAAGGATAGSTDGSNSGKSTEQGRNSTKRAAQNRAAQRAFRQRKDQYVRELERKADRLQQAEGQIMILMARNRELEAAVAQKQPGASSSPLPSPLLPQDSPRGGMLGPARAMDRGERDRDREREWAIHERAMESNGSFDQYHPSSRPALGRHSSVQHLRQAYNAASPPLSSSSMKHLSLSSKLSAPESDQEIEHQHRPHRHLHRHPSESSLNLHRSGAFPAFSTDPKDEDHQVAQRLLSIRGTPIDSRPETTSPPSTTRSPHPGSSGDVSMQYYPGSPLTPTHERSSLYSSAQNSRVTSSAGVGPRSLPSPTSAAHGDGSFPASASPAPFHPSSSDHDLGKKRPSDGTISWASQDLYKNPQDTHSHHPYHPSVKKQASWSSLSEQRRIHAVKKQPSYGSISEYRHSWRSNRTESPEMTSDPRFGGNSSDRGSVTPALPRIPPQFSQQRPPQPPTPQHPPSSFDREYPSPTAASHTSSTFSPPTSHPQQFQQHHHQQHSSHGQTSSLSDYYSPPRSAPVQNEHGPSDMDVVQEGSSGGNSTSSHHHPYSHPQHQAAYDSDEMDTYEQRRESSHD
ncbi:hypothetical protein K457DRAFT_124957 [Linnemannia elongata AG-77]|uniref:BZIP domain-containing protein n=1 Tax=Linnemannia elongata AG-77 TaxID=1314771 RepID=A0A197K2B9_9FUNG|nr:hypothetical protein K457DRAFT_124957 [Linnemannia elongata AG-77]